MNEIPSVVFITNVKYNVELVDYVMLKDDVMNGIIRFPEEKIYISKKYEFIKDNQNTIMDRTRRDMFNTLYHEIWHLYCHIMGASEADKELNAHMFAYIIDKWNTLLLFNLYSDGNKFRPESDRIKDYRFGNNPKMLKELFEVLVLDETKEEAVKMLIKDTVLRTVGDEKPF